VLWPPERDRRLGTELMARTWLSIRVDLVEGGGLDSIWPRPGRIFAAARSHTFAQLATAIDDAFARWDRSHLHLFELAETRLIGPVEWDEEPEASLPSDSVRLSRLKPEERFTYTFDLGDDWTHLCTVADSRIDPLDTLGIVPDVPLPYWGWGQHPRPVRTAVQRRRRRDPAAARPASRRPAAAPSLVGQNPPVADSESASP
jgi:Plasmid pRiA4b ORF-3-like protein